jgi:enamine deaminase RidA (YjgF/YER057c/UK114 family)
VPEISGRGVGRAPARFFSTIWRGEENVTRTHITTGSSFETDIGYSRAVVCDGWVFVSGTTGYDYATMSMPDAAEDQCRNALSTIERALREAGASLDDVVRVRYILPDPADWPPCWPLVAAAFATARPAATMISAGLQEREMRIEIEATARLPQHVGRMRYP